MNKPEAPNHAFDRYPTEALLYITNRPPLVFTEGQGMWLTDHNGKRYLDWLQGWAVNCLGHSPQCLQDALVAQAKKVINPSPAFFNEPSIKLANMLTEHSCFDRVFFALATMSASGKEGWDTMFAPQVPGFPKAELNNLASVEALIGKHTVAVMLEPVQGEGGVIPATKAFMQGLRALTTKHDLLLIVDEVQAGMGRTGKLFAYQLSDIEPDIMTLGKGIGGGVPLSALLCKEACAVFEPGDQGGTYNGNPLMTAAGIAVLEELLKPGFLQSVIDKGNYLRDGLLKLSDQHGLDGERGEGLLRALKLGKPIGGKIVEIARDLEPQGLLLNSPRPDLLRFMSALNVTTAEIDLMLALLSDVIAKVSH
ncbi:MAG: aminotransferase class III-fold pyridoxal phosphate-dependent enzyme [Oxalobacteraceae bacterium]|nr:aminotransferase class III-fold pyridoxal phosphate-dependent enzyme [Oxalobacteraceae bacterium]